MKTVEKLLVGLISVFVIVSLLVVRVSAKEGTSVERDYLDKSSTRYEKPIFLIPIIDSITASSLTVAPGEVIMLRVDAHDSDCADVCTSGCGQVIDPELTEWTSMAGTFLVPDNGISSSPYVATVDWHAPATAGLYDIEVEIGDNGAFWCGGTETITDTITIEVKTPSALQVHSVSSSQSPNIIPYVWFALTVTGMFLFWFVKGKRKRATGIIT